MSYLPPVVTVQRIWSTPARTRWINATTRQLLNRGQVPMVDAFIAAKGRQPNRSTSTIADASVEELVEAVLPTIGRYLTHDDPDGARVVPNCEPTENAARSR